MEDGGVEIRNNIPEEEDRRKLFHCGNAYCLYCFHMHHDFLYKAEAVDRDDGDNDAP